MPVSIHLKAKFWVKVCVVIFFPLMRGIRNINSALWTLVLTHFVSNSMIKEPGAGYHSVDCAVQ